MTPTQYIQYLYDRVEKYNGITREKIMSSTRKREIAEARHVIVYMMRKKTSIKLKDVSALLQRNDHTTAIHSEKVVKDAIETNYFPIVNLVKYLESETIQTNNAVKNEVAQEIYKEISAIFAKYGINYGS